MILGILYRHLSRSLLLLTRSFLLRNRSLLLLPRFFLLRNRSLLLLNSMILGILNVHLCLFMFFHYTYSTYQVSYKTLPRFHLYILL
jgi:hypothetical protein